MAILLQVGSEKMSVSVVANMLNKIEKNRKNKSFCLVYYSLNKLFSPNKDDFR